jgi:transposase-like protein
MASTRRTALCTAGCPRPDVPNKVLAKQGGPEGWGSADKFAAVLESAALNESQLAEYCRKRGLYPEQVKSWRMACEQANAWDQEQSRRLKAARSQEKPRLRELERELKRKDKALAEAAALLVLRKNNLGAALLPVG